MKSVHILKDLCKWDISEFTHTEYLFHGWYMLLHICEIAMDYKRLWVFHWNVLLGLLIQQHFRQCWRSENMDKNVCVLCIPLTSKEFYLGKSSTIILWEINSNIKGINLQQYRVVEWDITKKIWQNLIFEEILLWHWKNFSWIIKHYSTRKEIAYNLKIPLRSWSLFMLKYLRQSSLAVTVFAPFHCNSILSMT